jgi:hypothetical protein
VQQVADDIVYILAASAGVGAFISAAVASYFLRRRRLAAMKPSPAAPAARGARLDGSGMLAEVCVETVTW